MLLASHLQPSHAGFSLSALEETMQENKRLSTSAAQSATLAIDSKQPMLTS
jgi:hypothetical protein